VADLQRIVDTIADRVGRPALVEDPRHRVLAYSEQSGPVDDVRLASILRRRIPPEVVAFVRRAGVTLARGPVRTPGSGELRMLARVCVPLRHGDLLLGYVWFIDPDRSISDADLAAVGGQTGDLSLALYRESVAGELASREEVAAVRLLLSERDSARREGLRALLDGRVLGADGPVTVLVAQPAPDADGTVPARVERALLSARRQAGPGGATHLVRHGQGVLVLSPGSPAGIADELAAASGAAVGLGQTYPELAHAHTSYEQARLAARVAVRLPALGPVASWAQLGVYRVFGGFTDEALRAASVHPGLERLLGDPANEPLLETLETYLDLAGNARSTATRLRLHRTSLYYRLQRVEQLVGGDLHSGSDRLSLHVALKLARLAGRYQPGTG
jgi:PucR C-terminal helix-turn-helix domain/GGDEF-like domain